jgi:hypothetical protein
MPMLVYRHRQTKGAATDMFGFSPCKLRRPSRYNEQTCNTQLEYLDPGGAGAHRRAVTGPSISSTSRPFPHKVIEFVIERSPRDTA